MRISEPSLPHNALSAFLSSVGTYGKQEAKNFITSNEKNKNMTYAPGVIWPINLFNSN